MSSSLSLTLLGLRQPLRTRRRQWLFLVIALLAFATLFALPVFTVPGNSFAFQLTITRPIDMFVLTLLSLLIGLVVVLSAEQWRCCRGRRTAGVSSLAQGGASTAAAAGTAVLGTAACSSCLAAVLGVVGLGGLAVPILENRTPVMIALVLLTATFVIVTARRIGKGTCGIPPSSRK